MISPIYFIYYIKKKNSSPGSPIKRKVSENVLKTHQIALLKKSGEGAPMPLNIVRSNTISTIFCITNEYFHFFLQNLTKYTPRHTKLHNFYKISGGIMLLNPLANAVHGASPHFYP